MASLQEQIELLVNEQRRQGLRVGQLEATVQEQAERIAALEKSEAPLPALDPVAEPERVAEPGKKYKCEDCQNRIYGNWQACPHCRGRIVET